MAAVLAAGAISQVGAPTASAAPATERVSVADGGGQASAASQLPAISDDGQLVAFESDASDLMIGGDNGVSDVFVHDRSGGSTSVVSVADDESPSKGSSSDPSLSDDGATVAFVSMADNLVSSDTNGTLDVFVRDRTAGTTERVSLDKVEGNEADGASYRPALSGNGRVVAFDSEATNIAPDDTNAVSDVFVRDRDTGLTEAVSVDLDGNLGDDDSTEAAVSADGRYVAFTSRATKLVGDDENGAADVFVRDRTAATTIRVSKPSVGEADDASRTPAISANGRYVAFVSSATNLVPDDGNGVDDVFVADLVDGTVTRVSVASDEREGNADSQAPDISDDGDEIVFSSAADTLVDDDANGVSDVFLHDLDDKTTQLVSVAVSGTSANGASLLGALGGAEGVVAFQSVATDLVTGDTNGVADVFVRDFGEGEPATPTSTTTTAPAPTTTTAGVPAPTTTVPAPTTTVPAPTTTVPAGSPTTTTTAASSTPTTVATADGARGAAAPPLGPDGGPPPASTAVGAGPTRTPARHAGIDPGRGDVARGGARGTSRVEDAPDGSDGQRRDRQIGGTRLGTWRVPLTSLAGAFIASGLVVLAGGARLLALLMVPAAPRRRRRPG